MHIAHICTLNTMLRQRNTDFSNKISCLNADNRNITENGMIARRHYAVAVFQQKSVKFDASAIINAIRFQWDSCKFQEDFRANISCDGADARKSGRRRIIRWWLMAVQPERCTCNANLIRCTYIAMANDTRPIGRYSKVSCETEVN